MKIVVFLPFLVAAEWVEIAQNNYRKDSKKPTRLYDYTTSKNTFYNNHTIVEHQWSKGYVHRINGANIKRLQGSDRRPTIKIERNPFDQDDVITTEKLQHVSENKKLKSGNVIIAEDQQSEFFQEDYHANQDTRKSQRLTNEHAYRNKHGDVTKILETKTSTGIETTERGYVEKQSFENTVKVLENVTEKERNVYETTPCPDQNTKNLEQKDVQNFGKNQNKTLKHDNKFNNKTKTNAIEVLIKFLNVVSLTIKQSTRRTFKSKIRYLEDLRDGLLAGVEDRIDSAFPDDNASEHRRRRAAGPESRGHVEFPSSESALMTISFLTFAVFLIKLVLQVIHTYKAKTMMVTPAVVATVGRAVFKKSTNN